MAERSNIFTIRLATSADIPALRELIDKSVRVLQREDYSRSNWMRRWAQRMAWIRN